MIEIVKTIAPFQVLDLHYRKLLYLFILFYNVWTFSIKLDDKLITLVPGGLQNPLIPVLYGDIQIRQYLYFLHTNIVHNNLENTVQYMILSLLSENKKLAKLLEDNEEANKQIEENSIPKCLYDFYMKIMPTSSRFADKSQHDFIREIKTKISFVKDIKFMPTGGVSFDLKSLVYTDANTDQFNKLVKKGIATNENYKTIQDKFATELTVQFATLAINSDFMEILKNPDFKDLKQRLGTKASMVSIPVLSLFPELKLEAYVCYFAPHILESMFLNSEHCTAEKMKDVQDVFSIIGVSENIQKYIETVVMPIKSRLLGYVTYDLQNSVYYKNCDQDLNMLYGNTTPFSIFLPTSCKVLSSNKQYLNELENLINPTDADKIKLKNYPGEFVNDVLEFYQSITPNRITEDPQYSKLPYKLHNSGISLMKILLDKHALPIQKVKELESKNLKKLFKIFAPSVFNITPLCTLRSVIGAVALEVERINKYGPQKAKEETTPEFVFGGGINLLQVIEDTDTLALFCNSKTITAASTDWFNGFKLMICSINNKIKNEEKEPLTDQNFYVPLVSFFSSFISLSNGITFYTNPLSMLSEHLSCPIFTKLLTELQNRSPDFGKLIHSNRYPLDPNSKI